MKVLIVGGGGREHAIAWKVAQSKKVDKMYCAPGNAGIAELAGCGNIGVMETEKLAEFAAQEKIDLTIIGPDDSLGAGVVDAFEAKGLRVFGPRKNAAIIEGSKVFSKNLMKKYNIPTAKYEVFTNADDAVKYLENAPMPTVIKADGLALGKGVIIAKDYDEAVDAVKSMMSDKVFGASGDNVVIEEFLVGPEVSVLAFTDGKTVVPMVSSMDHKRAKDNDEGLNTGGMGTVAPNPYYTQDVAKVCMEKIFLPTVNAMNSEGRTFKGCLYFGLMLTPKGPKVIEYNCRFGDPETEVVLPRLVTDIYDIFSAVADHTPMPQIEWKKDVTMGFVMASKGYPGSYDKGYEISGLDALPEGIRVFHMGTSGKDGKFYTSGGRVLMVVGFGADLQEAHDKALAAVESIGCDNLFYRRDIGWRVL